MLAAAMQAPLSAIVMVLELTHRLDSGMVPLMLVVAGASLVTRLFERRSIYTVRIASSGLERPCARAAASSHASNAGAAMGGV